MVMGKMTRSSLRVLEVLAKEKRPLAWRELLEKTGLTEPTLHRALKRLRQEKLVDLLLVDDKRKWVIAERRGVSHRTYPQVTVTLPKRLLEEIDRRRGLIPRSRYIAKILEDVLLNKAEEGEKRIQE